MTLLAIPNVSEGMDRGLVESFEADIEATGAIVLDVHMDATHNRSVLTVTGNATALVDAMAELAVAALSIDLVAHRGEHPRLGCLDVCPIVPHGEPMTDAVRVAQATGREIANRASLPVFLYGQTAATGGGRELPEIRRGGLEGLIERTKGGLLPDFGPARIDRHKGVVCVGARPPLIAFNIVLRCDLPTAKRLAATVRGAAGGLPGVRALGLATADGDRCQVSMNLTRPDETGIDAAFDEVAAQARASSASVLATEIVGLPPERYLPNPDAEAARLLTRPGRSLESVLRAKGY
jgi:glutamate formiminotransferase